jgi:hypothetical protein
MNTLVEGFEGLGDSASALLNNARISSYWLSDAAMISHPNYPLEAPIIAGVAPVAIATAQAVVDLDEKRRKAQEYLPTFSHLWSSSNEAACSLMRRADMWSSSYHCRFYVGPVTQIMEGSNQQTQLEAVDQSVETGVSEPP